MSDGKSTLIRRIAPPAPQPPAKTPPAAAFSLTSVHCPICRTENSPDAVTCTCCGALLKPGQAVTPPPAPRRSAPPTAESPVAAPPTAEPARASAPASPSEPPAVELADSPAPAHPPVMPVASAANQTRPLSSLETNDSFFGPDSILSISVRGAERTLALKPKEGEMIIGRSSPDSVMIPDIDLATFNAGALGVSRLHAALRRQANTLVLCDMGSLNHTHVNGQRLHPHEVRVLHDGDEVRFGQLITRVTFRRS